MIQLNFSPPRFKVKQEAQQHLVFDQIRKKWLVLTNEEWVRQNIIQYLVEHKGVPLSMIAVEKELMLGEMKKRFDILVYDKNMQPWLLVECKAQSISLSEHVLAQVMRYAITIPAPFLLISNGNFCFGWQRSKGEVSMIDSIPNWSF